MRNRLSLSVLVLTALSAAALGGGVKVWNLETQEDLSAGRLDGLSLRSNGELVLSASSKTVEGLSERFVWALARGGKGVLYAATGSPAALYRIEKAKAQRVYQSGEPQGTALAVDGAGNVYLGTAPRGIIFRIASDGKVTILADLEDNYIWALSVDSQGRLVAATGPNGRLYRIDAATGKAEVVFTSPKSHLMCMALGEDDTAWVGTQPGGLVYRIKPDGRPFVLMDAEEDEVHCLAPGPAGDVYVGTVDEPFPQDLQLMPPVGVPQPAQAGAGQPSAPSGPAVPVSGPQGTMRPRPGAPQGQEVKTGLYRIRPSGDIERIFTLNGGSIYSLAVGDDVVYAGSGTKGQIFGVENGDYTVMLDRPEQQVLCMIRDEAKRLVFGTGGPGTVSIVEPASVRRGEYESDVFDAGYLSLWGRLTCRARVPEAARVQVFVRVGNSDRPDETWTGWVGPLKAADRATPQLPLARFAQIKAVLERGEQGAGPVVGEIEWVYANRNRKPVIASFELDGKAARKAARGRGPQGQVPQPPAQPGGPQAAQQRNKAVHNITWNAADPDEDPLSFSLAFRLVGRDEWHVLEEDIRDRNAYAWDTERVPDGWYQVRLTVSDRLNNTAHEAAADTEISDPVLVDNRRPSILNLKVVANGPGGALVVQGEALDGLSRIRSVRVSVDGGEWQGVFAADGILDSRREAFRFRAEWLRDGREHVLVFSAEDEAENIGAARLVIQAGPAETKPAP
jgi:hypothetical protein